MRLKLALTAFAFGLGLSTMGQAGVVTDETTKTECSACHMAFPASLLPARSWEAIMKDLGNHFGEDATLAPDVAATIAAYLVANANDAGGQVRGFARRVPPDQTPLRITELPGFKREHGGFSAKTMARVGTLSNCVGCHQGAEQGVFGDD